MSSETPITFEEAPVTPLLRWSKESKQVTQDAARGWCVRKMGVMGYGLRRQMERAGGLSQFG